MLNTFGEDSVFFIYLHIWKRCTGNKKLADQLNTHEKTVNLPWFPLLIPQPTLRRRTCHWFQIAVTPQQLISSEAVSLVVSAVRWLWQSWSHPWTRCRICGTCPRLVKAPAACKRWPQLVTAHLQNVITPATEGFQLGNSYLCTLISFWYEHLLQQPVRLMTQSNSVCLKNCKASQQPAAHQITRQNHHAR